MLPGLGGFVLGFVCLGWGLASAAGEVRDHVIWPIFGTFEEWICNALVSYVKLRKNKEEYEYARIWERTDTKLLPVRLKNPTGISSDKWEPLDNLPPPYLMPPPQPAQNLGAPPEPSGSGLPPLQGIPAPPLIASAPPPGLQSPQAVVQPPPSGLPPPLEPTPVPQPFWQGAQPPMPQDPLLNPPLPELELASFLSPAAQVPQNPLESRHTPPARRTRRQLKKLNGLESENEGERNNLLPLQEVPTAPRIIGYINVPINTSDVRAFKKEMGKLMDDPLGVAERLDEFLGTSIYSYENLTAILRSLFNTEEREMIRQARMRDWECRNTQSTPGDQKWPSQDPQWNTQTEEGCQISKDSMIVTGAKGEPFKVPVVKNVEIESENKIYLGDMLLVEEADYNLLGRDLMVALGINLIVKDSRLLVSLYKLTLEDEKKINQKVWHTGREAGKLDMEPISIEIERPEDPIRVKQYPISLEGRRALKPIIEDLIAKGILEPCMSRHNTPILAIRKTDGSY
ncbi:hypothetical protein DUI87_27305 [Hirundo rustica rustica]|uniref:Uncharacterized protein n=1 Tax=Hirundo rustica rustica TaxID=333673 RepID=A0A3M0J611_HIRRU|nr:hypothetical protein DUI87_27305 [Hirundo rustica rustica]